MVVAQEVDVVYSDEVSNYTLMQGLNLYNIKLQPIQVSGSPQASFTDIHKVQEVTMHHYTSGTIIQTYRKLNLKHSLKMKQQELSILMK